MVGTSIVGYAASFLAFHNTRQFTDIMPLYSYALQGGIMGRDPIPSQCFH